MLSGNGEPPGGGGFVSGHLLKMYEVREGLSVEKNPKSFLMGVSVNLYRNRRRKYAIRRRILGAETAMEDAETQLSCEGRGTEEQILYKEECELLRRMVKELPDKYRIPVVLFLYGGTFP